jgi:hypothetical protein
MDELRTFRRTLYWAAGLPIMRVAYLGFAVMLMFHLAGAP